MEELFEKYFDKFSDWCFVTVRDVLLALLCLVVGFKLSKMLLKVIDKHFKRAQLNKSVEGFLLSLIKWTLYFVVIIWSATILGFKVTSLITILGSAGLTLGLALQGSLANLAGGVLILILKPFQVGDFIRESEKGLEGTVTSIDIFYTRLVSVDNRMIIIPNGNIMKNSLINMSAVPMRRINMTIGVSYNSDLKQVRKTLERVVNENPRVLKDKMINTFVDSFDESSIKVGLRCYVKTEEFWDAQWEINEAIKEAFEKDGISIPFPQVDVHMKNSIGLTDKEGSE